MPDTTNTKSDLEILTQLNADFLASAQNGDVRVAVTVLRWKVSGQAFPSPGFRVPRLPVPSGARESGIVSIIGRTPDSALNPRVSCESIDAPAA